MHGRIRYLYHSATAAPGSQWKRINYTKIAVLKSGDMITLCGMPNRHPETLTRRKGLSPDENVNLLLELSENESDGVKWVKQSTTSQQVPGKCVVATYAVKSAVTSHQGPRNSPQQGARFLYLSLFVALNTHTVDSTIWLGSTQILRENTQEELRDLLSLFLFSQPHKRTCGVTAI
ncbi:hypothetical protein TNCV_4919091 [Trichonephila clavipes]|nr:hypothetical protein TNCV_4919091 [Trichonephila clavipes]